MRTRVSISMIVRIGRGTSSYSWCKLVNRAMNWKLLGTFDRTAIEV